MTTTMSQAQTAPLDNQGILTPTSDSQLAVAIPTAQTQHSQPRVYALGNLNFPQTLNVTQTPHPYGLLPLSTSVLTQRVPTTGLPTTNLQQITATANALLPPPTQPTCITQPVHISSQHSSTSHQAEKQQYPAYNQEKIRNENE